MTPIADRVFAGEAVQMDDLVLMLERHDQPEETHFSFSFTPVRDDAGAAAGIFCACTETTTQVMAARQLAGERLRRRRLLQQMPGFVCLLSGPEHI